MKLMQNDLSLATMGAEMGKMRSDENAARSGDNVGKPEIGLSVGKQIVAGSRGIICGHILWFCTLGYLDSFGLCHPRHFLEPRNLSNLFRQTAINGYLAIGMVFIITAGHIDLSVGLWQD